MIADIQRDTYVFRLEFTDEAQTPIQAATLVGYDFHRAIAETTFAAFQRGELAEYAPHWDGALIEPRFSAGERNARASGFRVVIPRPDGRELVKEFGIGYFAAYAARRRASILHQQNWPQDRSLYYTLAAYLDDPPSEMRVQTGLAVSSATIHVPLDAGSRRDFAASERWDEPQADDLSVLISRSVIEQACEEARRYPEREIGGLLLGNLVRDPLAGEVILAITCLVSGEGTTEGTAQTVTFTAESFARAREMAALRARPGATLEFVVGWHHSHPFRVCESCPLPMPPECLSKILFFSADDIQLMESTFFQPFHVGLLTAIEPRLETALGHLPAKLFGWRNGEVVGRGFEVIDN